MKTNKEIQANFKARMREKGYIQMAVWVPAEQKNKVKNYINEICEQARAIRMDEEARHG